MVGGEPMSAQRHAAPAATCGLCGGKLDPILSGYRRHLLCGPPIGDPFDQDAPPEDPTLFE